MELTPLPTSFLFKLLRKSRLTWLRTVPHRYFFQYCNGFLPYGDSRSRCSGRTFQVGSFVRRVFYCGKGFAKILLALLLLLPSSMRICLRTTHGGKVMQTTLRMFTRFGLVCLLVIGLQVMASAQGRGRGGGGSKGGPPAGTGVDRGIGRSPDASAGRADKGRGTASDKSKGRSDAGRERARDAKEKAKSVAKDRRRDHRRCVKDCDRAHKNAVRACRCRTG